MEGKIKILQFEKDGIVFERCKTCPDSSEKFVSTIKHKRCLSALLNSSFNGVKWALANGYKPKRFTIIQ